MFTVIISSVKPRGMIVSRPCDIASPSHYLLGEALPLPVPLSAREITSPNRSPSPLSATLTSPHTVGSHP